MLDKVFDGKKYKFYKAYRWKRDATKKKHELKEKGYHVRIFTTLEKRGSNRHEVYYRRK